MTWCSSAIAAALYPQAFSLRSADSAAGPRCRPAIDIYARWTSSTLGSSRTAPASRQRIYATLPKVTTTSSRASCATKGHTGREEAQWPLKPGTVAVLAPVRVYDRELRHARLDRAPVKGLLVRMRPRLSVIAARQGRHRMRSKTETRPTAPAARVSLGSWRTAAPVIAKGKPPSTRDTGKPSACREARRMSLCAVKRSSTRPEALVAHRRRDRCGLLDRFVPPLAMRTRSIALPGHRRASGRTEGRTVPLSSYRFPQPSR